MALGEQEAKPPAGKAQVGAVEPSHCLTQIRNSGIDPTCFYFRITMRRLCRCGVVWQWSERQRFTAILGAAFGIALVAVRQSQTPQSDHSLPNIIEGSAMFDGPAAVF